MFENIGNKIKMVAVIQTWIGIITSVFFGLYLLGDEGIGVGIFVIIIGPLYSWLSAIVLYGFGELIEKVTAISTNTSLLFRNNSMSIGNEEVNNNSENYKNCNSDGNNSIVMDLNNQDNTKAKKLPYNDSNIECSNCGERQSKNSSKCFNCNKKFI